MGNHNIISSRLQVIIFLLSLSALLVISYLLPLGELLQWIMNAIKKQGTSGMLVYGLLYIPATLLMIPASILTVGAGLLYGPFWGVVIVSPASVVSATISFVLGRHVLRQYIKSRIHLKTFNAVDRAIGRAGGKIVFLLRLSPIFPFALLNYSLGLTSIPLRAFVLASFLGMLPGTILHVYVGSLATSIADLSVSPLNQGLQTKAFYLGGLVITLIVIAMVVRIAQKALKKELAKSSTK
jgi:uncharacterized membrane protein YdjX (TVP38/TMEM64 family)